MYAQPAAHPLWFLLTDFNTLLPTLKILKNKHEVATDSQSGWLNMSS